MAPQASGTLILQVCLSTVLKLSSQDPLMAQSDCCSSSQCTHICQQEGELCEDALPGFKESWIVIQIASTYIFLARLSHVSTLRKPGNGVFWLSSLLHKGTWTKLILKSVFWEWQGIFNLGLWDDDISSAHHLQSPTLSKC